MKEKGVNPDNFQRVEFEIKVRMPVTTEQLEDESELLIESLTSMIVKLPYPYTSIGRFKKYSETSFRKVYPEKEREYRLVFYADILKP